MFARKTLHTVIFHRRTQIDIARCVPTCFARKTCCKKRANTVRPYGCFGSCGTIFSCAVTAYDSGILMHKNAVREMRLSIHRRSRYRNYSLFIIQYSIIFPCPKNVPKKRGGIPPLYLQTLNEPHECGSAVVVTLVYACVHKHLQEYCADLLVKHCFDILRCNSAA